jgi:hypothetical protein
MSSRYSKLLVDRKTNEYIRKNLKEGKNEAVSEEPGKMEYIRP